MRTLLCQKVPTEPGIDLATDVYLPSGPGPFPAVLVRTPYHRKGQQGTAATFVKRGYAYVTQDCRGKYDSGGEFTPLIYEAVDGQAAIDWVANQKWCNGRIGLWGRSYLGIVQVPAAAGAHEALKCMAPSVAPGSFFRDWIRYDGCFSCGNAIRWPLTHASCRTQPTMNHFDWPELHGLPDTASIAERVGFETPSLKDWAEHDSYDEYWEAIDQSLMHPRIGIPGFHAGGWFDHLTRSQYEAYENIRDHGATETARQSQRLLIGPWGHTTVSPAGEVHCKYGDWDFGPEADLNVLAWEMQFLDFYLKDLDNGFTSQPPVKVFIMGENCWAGFQDWPPPEAEIRNYFLDSGGAANMRHGDGRLVPEVPSDNCEDSFTYDPSNPVPTRGGAIYWGLAEAGPVDQRPILDRSDILYYRSDKLDKGMTVVGDINLELTIASDAEDTDFIAKLCVEEATGAITCLTVGSLRCRYRYSWSDPKPLAPGEPAAIRIRMGQTGYRFPEGSRIGLMITSSDFPRILPHLNRMAGPWSGVEACTARNSVMHGTAHPTRIQIPVINS
jgi:hypothetical protein